LPLETAKTFFGAKYENLTETKEKLFDLLHTKFSIEPKEIINLKIKYLEKI